MRWDGCSFINLDSMVKRKNFEEQTHTWLIREADKKDAKGVRTVINSSKRKVRE